MVSGRRGRGCRRHWDWEGLGGGELPGGPEVVLVSGPRPLGTDTGVLLRRGGEGLPNTGPRGQQACTLGAWSRESGNRGDGICPLYSNRR